MPKFRKLLTAFAIVATPLAVDTIAPAVASAAFTCGSMTSGTTGGGAYNFIECDSLQSPEWIQIWITCSSTGSTRYRGNKVYESNQMSLKGCGIMGSTTSVGWYHSA